MCQKCAQKVECNHRRASADLVAYGPYGGDVLAGGVVELPVLVAFARVERAGVTAAHGDHHVGLADGLVGQDLRLLSRDVDADLGHGLHGRRVDLSGGLRSS